MLCLLQSTLHTSFRLLFYASLLLQKFYYAQCILCAGSKAIGHAIVGVITLSISCMRVQFTALTLTVQYSIHFFTLYYS